MGLERIDMVDDFKARIRSKMVDAANVEQHLEMMVILEAFGEGRQDRRVLQHDRRLAEGNDGFFQLACELRLKGFDGIGEHGVQSLKSKVQGPWIQTGKRRWTLDVGH